MKYTVSQINKMKVVNLRRLVVDESIFKGGLSSLKKSDILDKIYQSQWWNEQQNNQVLKTEKEKIQEKLKELEKKLQEEKEKEKEEKEKPVEQQPVEQQPVEEQPVEQQPVEQQPVEEQKEIDIQAMISQALQQQKEDLLKRLFG